MAQGPTVATLLVLQTYKPMIEITRNTVPPIIPVKVRTKFDEFLLDGFPGAGVDVEVGGGGIIGGGGGAIRGAGDAFGTNEWDGALRVLWLGRAVVGRAVGKVPSPSLR